MAAYDSMRAISLNTKGDEAMTPILAMPSEAFITVTSHAQEGYIYYSEAFTGTVNRRFANGSGNAMFSNIWINILLPITIVM